MAKPYEEIGKSEFDRLVYVVSHFAVLSLSKILLNLRVEGQDNIPEAGRAILAFNHLHAGDVIFVPSAIPDRHVTVVGRRGQMERPLIGPLFKRWGAITIDRPDENPSLEAMRATLDAMRKPLDEGRLELVFGSGTRTPGKKPGISKRGVVSVAQQTKSPIIPGVIKGSDRLQEKSVVIKFGTSIGYPAGRRQHDEYLDLLLKEQTELFNSIPGSSYYAGPEPE
jgi:1-acyl-sn-glycerol-3-phosphate acyltransferase